jgi:ubiquinone biosynthesis accessory factor UbiJ
MPVPALITASVETALNGYLAMNPEAEEKLRAIQGRVMAIELQGLDITLYLVAHSKGIDVFSRHEGEPDAVISGTPLQLMSLSRGDAGSQLLSGEAEIRGDNAVAQRFSALLSLAAIDWEEVLAQAIGDIPAHQLGRLFRGSRDWLIKTHASLRSDLGEYLQEEVRILPSRNEIEAFMDDVGSLRSDADRLEARLKRLEDQHKS